MHDPEPVPRRLDVSSSRVYVASLDHRMGVFALGHSRGRVCSGSCRPRARSPSLREKNQSLQDERRALLERFVPPNLQILSRSQRPPAN